MSIRLTELEGQELQRFIRKAEQDTGFVSMRGMMLNQKLVSSADYKVMDASQGEYEGTKITFALLEMGENARIAIGEIDGQFEVTATLVDEVDGQEVLKFFRVVNGHIEPGKTIPFNEGFKKELEKLDKLQIKQKEGQIEAADQCWYGNWCGPGCGSGTPIDDVDICCQTHDWCYQTRGYFNCHCDCTLADCVYPYISYHQWASWIYYYMLNTCCR